MYLRSLLGIILVVALVPAASADTLDDVWWWATDSIETSYTLGHEAGEDETAEEPAADDAAASDEPTPADEAEPAPREERAPPEQRRARLLGIASAPIPSTPLDPVLDMLPLESVQAPLALPALNAEEDAAPAAPVAAAAPATVAAQSTSAAPAPGPATVVPPVAVVAAAMVVAQPTFSFSWERLRRFGWLALLYTRISKERLLDHERRDMLLQAIREHPGSAVADLAKVTDVPRNTAVYHLTRLEREGLVSSLREGRTRLYFAPGALKQRTNAEALAALRHDTSRAMAVEIGQQPGLDQHTLCEKFGLAPSLAHWHADRLVQSGIVEKRREGRHVRYYPGAAFALVSAVIIPPAKPNKA